MQKDLNAVFVYLNKNIWPLYLSASATKRKKNNLHYGKVELERSMTRTIYVRLASQVPTSLGCD